MTQLELEMLTHLKKINWCLNYKRHLQPKCFDFELTYQSPGYCSHCYHSENKCNQCSLRCWWNAATNTVQESSKHKTEGVGYRQDDGTLLVTAEADVRVVGVDGLNTVTNNFWPNMDWCEFILTNSFSITHFLVITFFLSRKLIRKGQQASSVESTQISIAWPIRVNISSYIIQTKPSLCIQFYRDNISFYQIFYYFIPTATKLNQNISSLIFSAGIKEEW